MLRRLNWLVPNVLAPSDYWMEMPLCGALFATIYQCTLVFLDWKAAHISLPLTKKTAAEGAPTPGSILFIAFDYSCSHYLAVSVIYFHQLKSFRVVIVDFFPPVCSKFLQLQCETDCPLPPVLEYWHASHDNTIKGIDKKYKRQIKKFKDLRKQWGRPTT